MKRLLIILLLCCAPVFGIHDLTQMPCSLVASGTPSATKIVHSGQTWDTVTISGTKLSSLIGGIVVGSNYWYIELASDTVRFGTDSTQRLGTYLGARGIYVRSGYHDITVHGGYVLHDPDNMEDDDSVYVEGDTLNYYAIGVKIAGNTYNILLDSIIKINVRGAYYSSAVEMDLGAKNVRLRKCRLFNNAYAYPSRTMFQATVLSISCDSAVLTAPGDYHMKVDSCYLEDNAHAAVYMRWAATNTNDRCNVKFYGDTFVVDARNKKYVGWSGALGKSTTQTYGIVATRAGRGTYVNHCTFLVGTKYGGGRGINFIGGDGVESEPIQICSSYFNCHEGYNQEYKSLYGCSAIKLRQINKWLNCFDNVVIVTVDTMTAICGQYNPNGEPICYQVWQQDAPPFHVNITNNICSLKALTNADAYEYDNKAFAFDYVKYEDTTSHVTGNYFYSQGTMVIDYGQFDGGADFVVTQGNTLDLDTTGRVYDQSTFNLGFWGGNAGVDSNIISLDDIFAGGASPNSVTHYYHGSPVTTGYQEIHIARTLNLHVKGSNGIGVSQAACSVWSQYGLVGTGLTDGTGNISIVCPYAYYSRTAPDSVGYNDYIVRAQKDTAQAYDSSLTINQVAAIVADTLTLTLGSNPPEGFDPAMRRIQRRWMFKL